MTHEWSVELCAIGLDDTILPFQVEILTITVPEPATLSLLALGGVALLRRRRHAAQRSAAIAALAAIVACTSLLCPAPAFAHTSGFVMASNVYGGSEDFNSFDPEYAGSRSLFTRVVNVKHCISYGVIDWAASDLVGRNTAGEQARLANWNTANDGYESLGHMGAGHINDPFRQSRGVVRYDADTFLILSSQYHDVNLNNARPPYLQQLEVHEDWFKDGIKTDDQYAVVGYEANRMIRSGSRPFNDGVRPILWGPEPDWSLDPNEYVDWSWTGGGTTGVLQWPDGSAFFLGTYTWAVVGLDPNDTTRDYVTGIDGTRGYMRVDNAAGDLYVSEFIPLSYLVAGWTSTPARSFGAELDVVVWYGGELNSANRIYTAQFDGRIYQIEAAKNLGSARRAGAPYPGARVTGTNYAKPLVTQSDPCAPYAYYPADYESGEPLLNDGPLQPSGAGTYSIELYSDAKAGERHYTGLAVDAGGRVYAASERLLENGQEPPPTFIGMGADVWGNYQSPGNHLLIDPNNAPFGTKVLVGDTVLLLAGGGTTDTTQVYRVDTILDAESAVLNLDPGWSMNLGNVTYAVYPSHPMPCIAPCTSGTVSVKIDSRDPNTSMASVATNGLTDLSQDFSQAGVAVGDWIEILDSDDPNDGWIPGTYIIASVAPTALTLGSGGNMGTHPITDPNYPTSGDHGVPYRVVDFFNGIWTSEAVVDVYRDGSVIETIDLNALARKDGMVLGDVQNGGFWHDGTDVGCQVINGVVIHGDVEVDPTVSGGDVTRLWIACAGGDGDPDTNDGLTAVVVDVTIAPDGSVAGVSFVAGFDDADMVQGVFYGGSYNSVSYQPYNLWVLASDIEFDGLGNLVYMGNRGYDSNRYSGFTAMELATAVDTALNDPGELDGIVNIAGLALDMNIYGFGSNFGLAFTNSPLENFGSATGPATAPQAYIAPDVNDPDDMTPPLGAFSYQMELAAGTGVPTPITWALVAAVPGDMAIDASGLITWNPIDPDDVGVTYYINVRATNMAGSDEETFAITAGTTCDAVLVTSDPLADRTLSQLKNNCIRLTFDKAITVDVGQMLSIVACPGGADVSALFTYSVEGDGVTLRAAEIGVALTNQTWYRVTEGSICVAPFTRDFCTLIGDASGDGRVLAQDLGVIWSKVGTMAACTRQDISGDGRVLAQDLGVAWAQNGQVAPTKP